MAEGKHTSPDQEESITKAAKAFIVNPNASSDYIQAVSSTVATMVSAIEAKVEREVSESSKATSSPAQLPPDTSKAEETSPQDPESHKA